MRRAARGRAGATRRGVRGNAGRGAAMDVGGILDSGLEAELAEGEPEAKKRRRQCAEFAAVASCDAAVAQCYLAENDWEMERALNSYFEPPVEDSVLKGSPGSPPKLESVDLTVEEETAEPSNSETCSSEKTQQEDGSTFSVITWNIDGLDIKNLQERARGVCSYLALYNPDVIFLQEVIPPYFSYLKKRAKNYEIIPGNEQGYFTVIMLKKSRVKFKSQEIIPFPNTQMMRNLLCVHVNILGNELCLMTSHLESTRGHAPERMNQFKMVLKKIQEAPEASAVIFAGDTNLRDQEVAKCGGLPDNILDVWEFLGKPKHCQYTWDTRMNTNLGIAAACKLRFDRIYFRAASESGHVIPQSLDLLGLEKLECGRFPSDHWGILCNFDVIL